MSVRPKIRLYVDQPMAPAQSLSLSREHAHYLFNVMRLELGAEIALFNGRDGEWRAEVSEKAKRSGTLICREQVAVQRVPPDLWLLFAPIKKARTDFIVEKAAEMGVRRIMPVGTDFTNSERIRQDRLQAHAIEAAEQCGSVFVSQVEAMRPLKDHLTSWPAERHLIFADEMTAGTARGTMDVLSASAPPAAILIGPEGGFSDSERERLRGAPFVRTISLGPRILRADTAAVAALALWQAAAGDWK